MPANGSSNDERRTFGLGFGLGPRPTFNAPPPRYRTEIGLVPIRVPRGGSSVNAPPRSRRNRPPPPPPPPPLAQEAPIDPRHWRDYRRYGGHHYIGETWLSIAQGGASTARTSNPAGRMSEWGRARHREGVLLEVAEEEEKRLEQLREQRQLEEYLRSVKSESGEGENEGGDGNMVVRGRSLQRHSVHEDTTPPPTQQQQQQQQATVSAPVEKFYDPATCPRCKGKWTGCQVCKVRKREFQIQKEQQMLLANSNKSTAASPAKQPSQSPHRSESDVTSQASPSPQPEQQPEQQQFHRASYETFIQVWKEMYNDTTRLTNINGKVEVLDAPQAYAAMTGMDINFIRQKIADTNNLDNNNSTPMDFNNAESLGGYFASSENETDSDIGGGSQFGNNKYSRRAEMYERQHREENRLHIILPRGPHRVPAKLASPNHVKRPMLKVDKEFLDSIRPTPTSNFLGQGVLYTTAMGEAVSNVFGKEGLYTAAPTLDAAEVKIERVANDYATVDDSIRSCNVGYGNGYNPTAAQASTTNGNELPFDDSFTPEESALIAHCFQVVRNSMNEYRQTVFPLMLQLAENLKRLTAAMSGDATQLNRPRVHRHQQNYKHATKGSLVEVKIEDKQKQQLEMFMKGMKGGV